MEAEEAEPEPEYIEKPDLGEESESEEALSEALELDEEPEDIWDAEHPEPEPELLEQRDQPLPPEPQAAPAPSEKPEEPLLGEPTARLLEYLKGLADELPPDKKEEFDVEGLKAKIDDLIGKIKVEAERAKLPPPVVKREKGFGLLSSGEAKLASDPRRSALGRRTGAERREAEDRRAERERRESFDRRAGERRGPVPEIRLSEPISKEAATVKVAPDGTPTEVAGLMISPRMAKLIQIMRREKNDGR